METVKNPTREQLAKYEALKRYLESLGSVVVAFSSGVDSTFLLYAAHEALGDCAIAVTAASCSFPVRELNEAREFCASRGIGSSETDMAYAQRYASLARSLGAVRACLV